MSRAPRVVTAERRTEDDGQRRRREEVVDVLAEALWSLISAGTTRRTIQAEGSARIQAQTVETAGV